MDSENQNVVAHYGRGDLMERIRSALREAGYDPDKPTLRALSELDHLHGGGYRTTVVQTELAGIAKRSHVLDAGCGIGGPSRYLADAYGCTVQAIDLTPEFVAAARELNALVGLGDRIEVSVASVTDLPFEDQSFDVVVSQNVSMNVADKPAMFREAFRVLKPGGIYTLSHLAEGPNGAPVYPLPWARTPDVSFLGTPDEMIRALVEAGFEDAGDRMAASGIAPGGTPPQAAIGPVPAMGNDMPERQANVARSIEEGRLVPMMIVAHRP